MQSPLADARASPSLRNGAEVGRSLSESLTEREWRRDATADAGPRLGMLCVGGLIRRRLCGIGQARTVKPYLHSRAVLVRVSGGRRDAAPARSRGRGVGVGSGAERRSRGWEARPTADPPAETGARHAAAAPDTLDQYAAPRGEGRGFLSIITPLTIQD